MNTYKENYGNDNDITCSSSRAVPAILLPVRGRSGKVLQFCSRWHIAERGQIPKEEAERKRAVYAFLGTCTQDQIYDLFDSSAFNTIVKDYVKLALKNTETDEETSEKIMQELRWLFDTKSSKEVLEQC